MLRPSFLAGPHDAGPPLWHENGVGHRQIRGRMTVKDELRPDHPVVHLRGGSLRPRAPRRQLDGEHHARLGHLHPPLSHGLVHIPAGLAHRDREPGSQHRGGLRHRDTSLRQLSRRVDPPGVLRITCAAATSHDTNILPDMSPITRNTPWSFEPPVAQSDVKAEVARCGGVVASPVLSNIYLDKLDKFVETVLIPEYTR